MGDGTYRNISALMNDIINKVKEISQISDYIVTVRKPFVSLARRLSVLIPFFEEIRDNTDRVSISVYDASISLFKNLETTRKLLRQGSKGSKIYVVLNRKQIKREYELITDLMEMNLRRIYCEDHDISYEVKEHAAVVLSQFERAKGKFDQPDGDQLYEDLYTLYDKGTDVMVDPLIMRELVETLKLTEGVQIETESVALNNMASNSSGDPGQNLEKMLTVLKLIKDFVQGGNQSVDKSLSKSPLVDLSARQGTIETKDDNTTTPNEFLCPISLQLMQDPVVISSGQTYERTSIETWMQAGNRICPKTRQILANNTLTPNFALRSLITQWCETNGMNRRKGAGPISSSCTPMEYWLINRYIKQLKSNDLHQLRTAAAEISLLSRRNSKVRVAIAEAGAIPSLVKLLKITTDPRTQEYAMIALLNLSICEENKKHIVSSGAIPIIIEVMKCASIEACEHGAAILYSLAVNDHWKNLIGLNGGIKQLVWLLGKGTERGRKDAANALYNLCLYPWNTGRAVREGIVTKLMNHVREPEGHIQDEALALLDMIKRHRDAARDLDAEDLVGHLVNIVWTGSQMNQEHAASVLLYLCSRDPKHLEEAAKVGAAEYLGTIEDFGSDRGRKKGRQLLGMIVAHMYNGQRKRARNEPNVGSGSGSSRVQNIKR